MNKLLPTLFLPIIIVTQAFGYDCAITDKQLAKELIKMELSGIHFSDQEKSTCLSQNNFKSVKVVYDPPNEKILTPSYLVTDMDKIKISKTDLIDQETNSYKVTYQMQAESIENKQSILITDSITYFKYLDKENRRLYGCAAPLSLPKEKAILKNCYQK